MKQDALILVRGGGDLATGTIHRLWSAGLRVLVLETAHPAAIRRQVSLCEAVYEGETTVEGLRAVRIDDTGTGSDRLGTECGARPHRPGRQLRGTSKAGSLGGCHSGQEEPWHHP